MNSKNNCWLQPLLKDYATTLCLRLMNFTTKYAPAIHILFYQYVFHL